MSAEDGMIQVDGAEVRGRYFDDLSEACEVVRDGCALFDLPWRTHLVVTGAHTRRFVHNMTTCQVKDLQSGQGRFGMTVDSGGKLVADFFLDAEEDRLVIESSRTGVQAMFEHLKGHIIADRVVLSPESQGRVLALTGAGSESVLRQATGGALALEEPFDWCLAKLAGQVVRVRRNPHRLGLLGWDVTVVESAVEDVRRELLAQGATSIGHEAFELTRVLAGVPDVPTDMGTSNVPLESTVLYEAVDWEKGCYLGQEVIAMMHYRGRPNRHLRGLALTSREVRTGAAVTTDEGREVGYLGTVVDLPGSAKALGLAVIKRKYAEPGTLLVVDELPAEVVDLPVA